MSFIYLKALTSLTESFFHQELIYSLGGIVYHIYYKYDDEEPLLSRLDSQLLSQDKKGKTPWTQPNCDIFPQEKSLVNL